MLAIIHYFRPSTTMRPSCPAIVAATVSLISPYSNLLLTADAFPLLGLGTRTQRTNVLLATLQNDDFFDIEAARRELEVLVGGGGSPLAREQMQQAREQKQQAQQQQPRQSPEQPASEPRPRPSYPILEGHIAAQPSLNVELPPPPPLTTIERARRHAEIELLEKIDSHGDEFLSEIWSLWFSERGPQAEKLLYKADSLIKEGPPGWGEAEVILLHLVDEYGLFFFEPINRLATLYYLQGKLEEAEILCKTALAVKPWHFGALSTIVRVYADLGDSENAKQWAAHRLPSLGSNVPSKRRHRWVERAVQASQKALADAEHRIVESFGESDADWIALQQQGHQQRQIQEHDDYAANSWQ
jgi:tetratricopeptide (TPR) repeat protein